MKKQIIHTIAFVSTLLVGNQALAYSWYLQNEAGYPVNGNVSLIDCGKYTDLSWKSVPTGSQQSWLGTGGVEGCDGTFFLDDYVKASFLGNVDMYSLQTLNGANLLYCGYYETTDQLKATSGRPEMSAAQFTGVLGITVSPYLQIFPNYGPITWTQSSGICPAPIAN